MQNNLRISQKLTENQITQLITYSNSDSLVIVNTNDKKRFKDRVSFNKWLKKDRQIFVLEDGSKKLMGIIWFSEKPIPKTNTFLEIFNTEEYKTTFVIRLYDNARGKGLSKIFMKDVFGKYKKEKLWLQTKEENQIAVNLYLSFGFIKVANADENGKIIMIMR